MAPWELNLAQIRRRFAPLGKADHLTLEGRVVGHAWGDTAAARRRFDTQTGRRLDDSK